MARPSPRKRRSLRQLEELPTLFDAVDIDMTRHDSLDDAGATVPTAHVSAEAANQSVGLNPASLARPEAIRFISFGSGSSGNCAYLGNSDGGILIDAGVDNNTVMKQLVENGIDARKIAGIVLTHDHSDHVRYAYALLRHNRHMLLYCTQRALNGLLRRHSISRRIKDYHKPVYKEFEFEAGGFTITPFETSHDGSDNAGFYITRGNHSFVVATDMGVITARADHYMRRAHYLMLESNYDAYMLEHGRYAEFLKSRIRSATGHLDNRQAAEFAASLFRNADGTAVPEPTLLTHLFLCHLSDDNNTPEKALECMREALAEAGAEVCDASEPNTPDEGRRVRLTALPRYVSSPLYILRR